MNYQYQFLVADTEAAMVRLLVAVGLVEVVDPEGPEEMGNVWVSDHRNSVVYFPAGGPLSVWRENEGTENEVVHSNAVPWANVLVEEPALLEPDPDQQDQNWADTVVRSRIRDLPAAAVSSRPNDPGPGTHMECRYDTGGGEYAGCHETAPASPCALFAGVPVTPP